LRYPAPQAQSKVDRGLNISSLLWYV
jgi:hypothetical protein